MGRVRSPRGPAGGGAGAAARVVELEAALEGERARREAAERETAELLIENGRLRGAVAEGEAREAAAADVLRLIGEAGGDAQAALDAIAERAARLCGAADATLFLLEGESVLTAPQRTVAKFGDVPPALGTVFPPVPLDQARLHHGCSALLDRRTIHILDQQSPDTEFPYASGFAKRHGLRTYLVVPLLRGDTAIGVFQIRRSEVRAFTEQQIALVETFARQAAVAIEHARLFKDLRERLEEQRATAEVLQAISRSPTELRRVLDAIAESAARLCVADQRAANSNVWRVEGDVLRFAATWDPPGRAPLAAMTVGATRPIDRRTAVGRAVVDRSTLYIRDLAAVPVEEMPHANARAAGIRTIAVAPLMRGDAPIGALNVAALEPDALTERQLRMLETFADQAVIAIENTRLFTELRESNATLKEALEQQTVTAEVLRVISTSPTDLDPVLHEIAAGAGRLCGADSVLLRLRDGEDLVLRAVFRATVPKVGDQPRPRVRRAPGELAWRVMEERLSLDLRDLQADYPETSGARAGVRSLLCVPLLRQREAVGVLQIVVREVRPFTEAQIKLVETFADQAVIAVENSRLFNELRERDERRRQELERASAIQQRLLPASIEGWPGLLEVAVRFRAAVETSGDFYDVLRLSPRADGALPPLQIAVGDVAGKGMSAALVTALARSALQLGATVPTGMATPASTLRIAGQRLHRDVGGGHFVACALGVVEPPGLLNDGPLLRLSNAAQVPVLLVRGGAAREIEPPGDRLPLGTRPDGAYKDAEVELRPGDVVVLSSDGLVEAPAQEGTTLGEHLVPPGRAGELFGFARLSASTTRWATQSGGAEHVAAGVWADLSAWCGEESHHDDMTLLVLRVPGAGR